jgi:hypothetical protein
MNTHPFSKAHTGKQIRLKQCNWGGGGLVKLRKTNQMIFKVRTVPRTEQLSDLVQENLEHNSDQQQTNKKAFVKIKHVTLTLHIHPKGTAGARVFGWGLVQACCLIFALIHLQDPPLVAGGLLDCSRNATRECEWSIR